MATKMDSWAAHSNMRNDHIPLCARMGFIVEEWIMVLKL
jgi:hypothetical protein